MRWMVVLVVMCACGSDEGGKGKKDKDKKERVPDCEEAAEAYADSSGRKGDRRDLTRRCEKHEWSRRMRKCVAAAETKSELRACEDAHTDRRSNRAADGYKTFADDICACANKGDMAVECAKTATDRYVKENMPKDGERMSAEDAADFAKETAGDTKRMTDCQMKIATAAASGAQPIDP